jgi:hypothetical protein
MKCNFGSAFTVFALIIACGYSMAIAAEEEINKKDVPAAVITAFEKAYPKAAIKGVEKSEKDGQALYEIGSMNGTSEIEAGYSADGILIQVTEDISVKALPAAVKKAIVAEYPKGKMKDVEKITRGAVVEYEVDVAVGKDKSKLILDEAGKIISTKKMKRHNEKPGKEGQKNNDEGKEND